MSYPDARCLGDEGEISATFCPADRKPELTIGSSTAVRYLASSTSTNGQFGLYRWDARPRTPGPSVHFHKTMSESFFLLSGTMGLVNGSAGSTRQQDIFCLFPRLEYMPFTTSPTSLLLLFAPGAPREAYFEALAEKAAGVSSATRGGRISAAASTTT